MFGRGIREPLANHPEEAQECGAEEIFRYFRRRKFLLEIQDHGLKTAKRTNPQIIALAEEMGIRFGGDK